ncbi:hypothetical protein IX51_00355 [uncultured archaeon]|nr:hypothetical protein IX51_00355 [uncultured archaeon]
MTEQNKTKTPQEGMKKGLQTQMLYMLSFFVYIIILSNTTLRTAIGNALDVVFSPLIGFNFDLPVLTLLLAGILIGVVTSIPRYFFTDWLKMGKAQNRMKAFSKTMREAYKSGQKDRIQKLRKMQMDVTMEQQQVSMNTMKPLMIFSVVTYLIFIWLFSFIANLPYAIVAFPWNWNVNLNTHFYAYIYYWIIIYFLAVMVVGYFVTMVIKYVDFTYKLRRMEYSTENEIND